MCKQALYKDSFFNVKEKSESKMKTKYKSSQNKTFHMFSYVVHTDIFWKTQFPQWRLYEIFYKCIMSECSIL